MRTIPTNTKQRRFIRQAEHRHAAMVEWLDSDEGTAAFEDTEKEFKGEKFATLRSNCTFYASLPDAHPRYWQEVSECLTALEQGQPCPNACTGTGWCDPCGWAYAQKEQPCPMRRASEMVGE